ncbi:GIY-YIG nuclease family protein [Aggregatilinea lenta]|uniref:GIY-YIG nuclease family protein n=1 Tax=Aggregatilinea lenta TaxID=913108 RepID=UPI0013C31683|nr:hypothetical protein [Aggregatilinea lenta]
MAQNNWLVCQEHADDILMDGLRVLTQAHPLEVSQVKHNGYGNYLISYESRPYYIGEAKNVDKRLKQQFCERTSTFYKDYQSSKSSLSLVPNLSLPDFRVQVMETHIGRKEIEETGIVNLPTPLNKFQLGKRNLYQGKIPVGAWNWAQSHKDQLLDLAQQELFSQKPASWFDANPRTGPGLYFVEDEQGRLVYIGESSNLAERYITHSRHTYFSALRRNLGVELFGFTLQIKSGRKRGFTSEEDDIVTDFLGRCRIRFQYVNFGRCELEEHLIRTLKPLVNRKENKHHSE